MTQIQVRSMQAPAGSGKRISFLGMDLIWKITSEMSRGTLVSFVHVAAPGTGVPMHIHPKEEENIFLVDGNLVFRLGDETFDVSPGDIVRCQGAPRSISSPPVRRPCPARHRTRRPA